MRTLAAFLFFTTIVLGQECAADGTVVNSVTGAPIARASVNGVLTDASGRFSLEHLPCGSVTINAGRQGFLTYQPGTAPIRVLDAASPIHGMTIRLAPQAVVTGHVRGEEGDPVQNAQISVMISRVFGGKREFFPQPPASTNDIGEYRVAGLSAGRYMFCVKPASHYSTADAIRIAYEPQCSETMTIPAGHNGVLDFQLTPAVARRVRGILSGAPEGAGVQITLTGPAGALSAGAREDGAFEFEGVAAGSYVLAATAFQENDRFATELPVEVRGGDVEGIRLHLEKGFEVAGTVRVISTGGRTPDAKGISAQLVDSQMFPPRSTTEIVWSDDRSAFTFTGVTPQSYRLGFSAPAPFYVKSATVGGRNIFGAEVFLGPGSPDIAVVLSDDSGTLEGDVSADDGAALAAVLLEQDGTRHWYERADSKGHFKIEALPPGDYKASAWDVINNVEYADPTWMQLNAKTVPVSIQAGQTTRVKLVRQAAPNE